MNTAVRGGLSEAVERERGQDGRAVGLERLGDAVQRHIGQRAGLGGAVEQVAQRVDLLVVFEQVGRRAAAHDGAPEIEPDVVIPAQIFRERR